MRCKPLVILSVMAILSSPALAQYAQPEVGSEIWVICQMIETRQPEQVQAAIDEWKVMLQQDPADAVAQLGHFMMPRFFHYRMLEPAAETALVALTTHPYERNWVVRMQQYRTEALLGLRKHEEALAAARGRAAGQHGRLRGGNMVPLPPTGQYPR